MEQSSTMCVKTVGFLREQGSSSSRVPGSYLQHVNLHPTIKPMLVFRVDPDVLWNRLIDSAQGCPNDHVYRRGMFPSSALQTGECLSAFLAIGQLRGPGLDIDPFAG